MKWMLIYHRSKTMKLKYQLGDNEAELSQLSETEAESSQVHDNTEHQITEALTQLPFLSDVSIDYRPNKDEDHIVSRFMSAGCGCARKCHLNFSTEYVSNFRLHCLELTTPELDLAVLGQISMFTNTSSNVSDTSHAATIRNLPTTIRVDTFALLCLVSLYSG